MLHHEIDNTSIYLPDNGFEFVQAKEHSTTYHHYIVCDICFRSGSQQFVTSLSVPTFIGLYLSIENAEHNIVATYYITVPQTYRY